MADTAADRFDEMCLCPPMNVSERITVALEFVLELQQKGLCNDYGMVSWSEKDGLMLTAPCPRIAFERDSQSDVSSQQTSL